MKRTLIFLAVVTMVFGFAAMASAKVVLEGNNPAVYASEIDCGATGYNYYLQSGTTGDVLNVENNFGFGCAAGEDRYLRYDLSGNATFANTPYLTIHAGELLTNDPNENGGVAYHVTLEYGGAGRSFVIFHVSCPDTLLQGILITDLCDLRVADVSQSAIRLGGKDGETPNEADVTDVTMDFEQYDSIYNANNRLNPVYWLQNRPYITWADALKLESYPVYPESIDVFQDRLYFTGGTGDDTTNIGSIRLSVVNNVLWQDGNQANISEIVATLTASTFTITANMSAAKNIRFVNLTYGGFANATLNATKDEATLNFLTTGGLPRSIESLFLIQYVVTGTDIIYATDFNGCYNLIPAAGSDLGSLANGIEPESPVNPAVTCFFLSHLDYNAQRKSAYNISNPAGMNPTYIRITNTGNQPGPVWGDLYDQSGNLVVSNGVIKSDTDPLNGHATFVIGPDTWATLPGSWPTSWDGSERYRLVVIGAVSGLEVMDIINTGGVLVNMSPTAPPTVGVMPNTKPINFGVGSGSE